MDTLFQSRRQHRWECCVKNHFAHDKDEHFPPQNPSVDGCEDCTDNIFCFLLLDRGRFWAPTAPAPQRQCNKKLPSDILNVIRMLHRFQDVSNDVRFAMADGGCHRTSRSRDSVMLLVRMNMRTFFWQAFSFLPLSDAGAKHFFACSGRVRARFRK